MKGNKFMALCLLLKVSLGQTAIRSAYLDDDAELNDVISQTDVLFDVRVRSRIDCARRCVSAENCASSTYYKTDTMTSCRGYTTVMTSTGAVTAVAGARTSIRRVPNAADTLCPVSGGYIHDNETGLCFAVYTSPLVTWDEARAACQAGGADLVTLNTSDRSAGLYLNRPEIAQMGKFWIGLRRDDSLGAMTTSTSASEYAWARTGEFAGDFSNAMNSFNYPCVVASYDDGNFWQTWDCQLNPKGFICEKE